MHILSDNYRTEFLGTPTLVRLDYSLANGEHEPTILIKANTLILKYIVKGAETSIVFAKLNGHLLYGVKINDDPSSPSLIWSILENENEIKALTDMANRKKCKIHLFNELAVNVVSNQLYISMPPFFDDYMSNILIETIYDHNIFIQKVTKIFDQLVKGNINNNDIFQINLNIASPWEAIKAHYVTNSISHSTIDLFNFDEGNQQEHLAIWLTDNLQPSGAHHSPQIIKKNLPRELIDVLLSYEYGSFLIESKTLTVFNQELLPSQTKLAKNITKHIKKAISQLKGAIKQLKNEVTVMKANGEEIIVERSKPMHAIVLLPDLGLIQEDISYKSDLIQDFLQDAGGFIHFLDIAELLRVVQAAEMIASMNQKTTPMMAFDYYLMERVKKCQEVGKLNIEVLLRVE